MLIEADDTKIQEILKSLKKNRKASQSQFSGKLSELIQRCDSAGISHIPESISDQENRLIVQISSGREKIDLHVREPQQADLLLSIPFEKVRG